MPDEQPQPGEPGTVAVTVETTRRKRPTSANAPEQPRLRISDLGVTYIGRDGRETEAVREVTLDIVDKPDIGEIVVFLGPSGCGKSTILKAVAGLLAPTRGEILVDGAPVTGVGRDRGMVFQAYTSFGWLTVRAERRVRPSPAGSRPQRAEQAIEEVPRCRSGSRSSPTAIRKTSPAA